MPGVTEDQNDQHAASIAYQREEEADSALSEVLRDPPSVVGRGLLYIVLALVVAGFAWASFNKIDIVVAVPATVIPEGKLRIIQTPHPGTVQEILVEVGQDVGQGDVLLVYESAAVSDLLADLKARQAELVVARTNLERDLPRKVATLQKLIEMEEQSFDRREIIHNATLIKLDEKMSRLNLEIENARGRLMLMDREVEVNDKLAKKGIVAERKMLELRRLHAEAAIEIDSLRSALRETVVSKEIEAEQYVLDTEQRIASIADLNQRIEEEKTAAQERHDLAWIGYKQAHELAELNLEGVNPDIIETISRGEGTATDIAAIVAPTDGVVAEVAIRNPGESIDRGQTLITLVPQGVELITELQIPDKEIGKVREGQEIRFKFDAFPFAEHGVLTGVVADISPSSLIDETSGDTIYRAKSHLSQDYFKREDGKTSLLPGMVATAEIRTEEKSVLSLLVRPFAELAKPVEAEQ